MRKSLLIMFLLFAAGITANAQKFALIDMEYILKNIPAYQSASNELNQVVQTVAKRSREAGPKKPRACTTATRHPSKLFPMHKRQRKRRDCCQREIRSRTAPQITSVREGELFPKKREALMQPIQDEIYEAVKEISTQKGYAVVVDRASASSIIFASPSIDISNEVLAKLGYSN